MSFIPAGSARIPKGGLDSAAAAVIGPRARNPHHLVIIRYLQLIVASLDEGVGQLGMVGGRERIDYRGNAGGPRHSARAESAASGSSTSGAPTSLVRARST